MNIPRSCLECRRRKIRCDRDLPCSYCTKVGVECSYPDTEAPSSAQRRQRSDMTTPTMVEISAKLRALEAQVQQLEARLCEVEGQSAVARTSSTIQEHSDPARSVRTGWLPGSPDVVSDTASSRLPNLRPWPEHHNYASDMVDTNQARSVWNVYLTDVGKSALNKLRAQMSAENVY